VATLHCGSVTFENIQAVIFDKDGTLADTQGFLLRLGWQRARLIEAQVPGVQSQLLQAFGCDRDRVLPAGLLAVGTRQDNEIAAAAYVAATGQGWLDAVQLVQAAFRAADQLSDRKAPQTPPIPTVLHFLQSLAAANLRIGLVSADSPTNVQDFLDYYSLNTLIPVAYGSTPALSKPAPALLETACYALNVTPAQTLVIGDAATDTAMAHAAHAAGALEITPDGIAVYTATQRPTPAPSGLISSFAEIQVMPARSLITSRGE